MNEASTGRNMVCLRDAGYREREAARELVAWLPRGLTYDDLLSYGLYDASRDEVSIMVGGVPLTRSLSGATTPTGERRARLLEARAAVNIASAAYLRAERAWLDSECDAEDEAHPTRVALVAAGKVRDRAEHAMLAVEDELGASEDLRAYTFRLVETGLMTSPGRSPTTTVWSMTFHSLAEARDYAFGHARGREGDGLFVVLIDGEDGSRDVVTARGRDW